MIFALFLIALAVSATAFDVAGLKHPREYYEEKFVDFMKKFSIQARDGNKT